MKRQLVLLVMMILVLSGVVMGGEEPGEVPRYVAKSALLATFDGIHIGRPKFEGSVNYPGGLGTIGYSVSVEPELKPTKELDELMHSRQLQPSLEPLGRLSLDRENRIVVYAKDNEQIKLPIEKTRHSVFQNPNEVFIKVWSVTIDAPSPIDLLLALTEGRLLIFAVQEENPRLWLASWIPVNFDLVDQERLNRTAFGLYREGDQVILFLPFERGDQAWEIHLPKTFESYEDVLRLNIFPITKSP